MKKTLTVINIILWCCVIVPMILIGVYWVHEIYQSQQTLNDILNDIPIRRMGCGNAYTAPTSIVLNNVIPIPIISLFCITTLSRAC